MRVPLTSRLLISLVAGLIVGGIISASGVPELRAIPDYIEPVGALWTNAIRMTVVPLIVSLLVTSLAGPRSEGLVAQVGGRLIALMCALVTGVALFAATVGPPLLSVVPLGAADASGAGPRAPLGELPPFRSWLVDLVPPNPIKSAVDGALLPLMVATAAVALALGRVRPEVRDPTVRVFEAIREAMFILIDWILLAAPVGVFALVIALAAHLGAPAARALGHYVLVASVLVTVSLLALYPIVRAFGGVRVMEFARAVAPAQVVAFTTRSSLAALPALATAAATLRLPPSVSGLVLPIAVSTFKYSSPIVRITGTLLVARLYGIHLEPLPIAAIATAIAILSFYTPGIPSGGLFVMTPIYEAIGLPVEGIGILIALDVIPDTFMTTANVTANLVVATLVSKSIRTSEG